MNYEQSKMIKKKYTLKAGKHQFAPGSAAIHHNDNLSDAEAEWYIDKYPHIKGLFEIYPTINPATIPSQKESVKPLDQLIQFENQSEQSQNQLNYNEDLSTTN